MVGGPVALELLAGMPTNKVANEGQGQPLSIDNDTQPNTSANFDGSRSRSVSSIGCMALRVLHSGGQFYFYGCWDVHGCDLARDNARNWILHMF